MTAPARHHPRDPREERRRGYLATLPATVRGGVERAFAGKASPRAAIKAYCLICSDCDRSEVAECTVVTCPLHSYRPFQKARNPIKTASLGPSCDGTAQKGLPA